MAPSIGDQSLGGSLDEQPSLTPNGAPDAASEQGPDPVIGAGLALFGIFLMGTGGARDAHYVFDVGVLVAVVGAAIFVLCVALSAMRQRKVELASPPPSAPPPAAAA
ncbi:MAG: hypothetical protein ABI193_11610 [Minicystis sp.]